MGVRQLFLIRYMFYIFDQFQNAQHMCIIYIIIIAVDNVSCNYIHINKNSGYNKYTLLLMCIVVRDIVNNNYDDVYKLKVYSSACKGGPNNYYSP